MSDHLPSRLHCWTVCIVGQEEEADGGGDSTARAAKWLAAALRGFKTSAAQYERKRRSATDRGPRAAQGVPEVRRRARCAPCRLRPTTPATLSPLSAPPPCAGEQPDSEDEAISSLGSGPNAGAAASDDVIDVDEADVDEADEEEEAATDSDDSDDGGNGASIASARRSAARVARSEPTAAAPQVYQAPPQ